MKLLLNKVTNSDFNLKPNIAESEANKILYNYSEDKLNLTKSEVSSLSVHSKLSA